MKKIKILVADDHALVREGIRALLALATDLEVVGEATTGLEAVEKARKLKPDVVLMDLSMPAMNGLEATRKICKEHAGAIRVLILTQHDESDYVLPVIQAGAKGFVTKMAAFTELVAAIRAVDQGHSFLSPSAATSLVEKVQDSDQVEDSNDPYRLLTDREREVLKLVAEGYTAKKIGRMLFISPKTVEWHRASLMNKLQLRNKTELIKFALRRSIIPF